MLAIVRPCSSSVRPASAWAMSGGGRVWTSCSRSTTPSGRPMPEASITPQVSTFCAARAAISEPSEWPSRITQVTPG